MLDQAGGCASGPLFSARPRVAVRGGVPNMDAMPARRPMGAVPATGALGHRP